MPDSPFLNSFDILLARVNSLEERLLSLTTTFATIKAHLENMIHEKQKLQEQTDWHNEWLIRLQSELHGIKNHIGYVSTIPEIQPTLEVKESVSVL